MGGGVESNNGAAAKLQREQKCWRVKMGVGGGGHHEQGVGTKGGFKAEHLNMGMASPLHQILRLL